MQIVGGRLLLSARPTWRAVVYVLLGENDQVKGVLEQAHKEVAALADRYIAMLNDVLAGKAPVLEAPPCR